MRRGRHGVDRTAARAWAVGALAALAAGGAWAQDAPACDRCEFLPCVQSELTHYKDMQKMLLDLATKVEGMPMNAFSERVDAETNKLLDRHNDRIKNKPACATRYPDGLLTGDYVAQRKWTNLGFGLQDLGGGRYSASWSAVTDPQKCELRERQLEAIKGLVACVDLAVATRKHEEKHVADCRKSRPETPQAHARFEAAGYAEGIKELEKTAKRLKDKKCPRPQPTPMLGPKAKEAMKKAIGAAGERLAMYAKAKGY